MICLQTGLESLVNEDVVKRIAFGFLILAEVVYLPIQRVPFECNTGRLMVIDIWS